MRFLGYIFQYGHALGLYRRQHHIDGRAHRNLVKIDVRTLHFLGIGVNQPVFNADLGAQQLKALDVLVDGPHAEIAPAGHGNTGLPEPSQQRPDKIVAGPHMLGKLVRDGGAV